MEDKDDPAQSAANHPVSSGNKRHNALADFEKQILQRL